MDVEDLRVAVYRSFADSGRLGHRYRRRDPSEAAGYFREVGLAGPFWNL